MNALTFVYTLRDLWVAFRIELFAAQFCDLVMELPQHFLQQNLRGHRQNLVSTRSQAIGAVSPQETEPYLPVSVQEALAEARVDSGLLRGQRPEYNSVGTSAFEGGCHHYNYPYQVWPVTIYIH